MKFEEALTTVFDNLYDRMRIQPADIDKIEIKDSICVIRSADMRIFRKFVELVRSKNPQLMIYVLTHSRDREEVLKICGENCEVVEYTAGGNYAIEKLDKQIEYLKEKSIDQYFILYNNSYGSGFDNIEDIMNSITEQSYYAFNSYWEFLYLEQPRLHAETIRLVNKLCDWYWEYLGSEGVKP